MKPVVLVVLMAGALGGASVASGQDDFEREPILYSQSTPENRVSRLEARIKSGESKATAEPYWGVLRSLLRELEVPESSQMLVFSKTSLQRRRISPRTPRAIYFNDDIYVGYCQQGDVLELTAVDPQLGAVFYTVDPKATPMVITRQTESCLICHGSSLTQGIPGHLARSVFVDRGGEPMIGWGTRRVDHTTPWEERWGGWYVTGEHGSMKHRGNLVAPEGDRPEDVNNDAGMNVTDLAPRFRLASYPVPSSDITALLVFEHQLSLQNTITKAGFTARQALHWEDSLNRELGKPTDHRWESTTRRIESTAEELVEALLFCGEPEWKSPVRGNSAFADEFTTKGPFDSQGRSLRQLDLRNRLFAYPCSYLIYSDQFAALSEETKRFVGKRLNDITANRDTSEKFAHLSLTDRQAIREILLATLPSLAEDWEVAAP